MDPARWPENVPEEVMVEFFVRAARESLGRMREAMHRFETHPAEPGARDVVRLCHNLKGSSRQIGLEELGDTAEMMEAVASLLSSEPPAAAQSLCTALGDAAERVSLWIEALGRGDPLPDLEPLTARLRGMLS